MNPVFAESAVLIDVMNGDLDEADARLDGFLPGELKRFEDQADLLGSRIRQARARKREEAPDRAARDDRIALIRKRGLI
jgi:hypothetical protein